MPSTFVQVLMEQGLSSACPDSLWRGDWAAHTPCVDCGRNFAVPAPSNSLLEQRERICTICSLLQAACERRVLQIQAWPACWGSPLHPQEGGNLDLALLAATLIAVMQSQNLVRVLTVLLRLDITSRRMGCRRSTTLWRSTQPRGLLQGM